MNVYKVDQNMNTAMRSYGFLFYKNVLLYIQVDKKYLVSSLM